MFEGIVAYLLNKYLGKYVRDLDSENLNVGIFSGTVQLTDLQLKPEALFELDLPIEVRAGCIGKISIDIPWTTLYTDPVLVHVEDILIVASPISDRPYDPEIEKRLIRAQKQLVLEEVKESKSIGSSFFGNIAFESRGFYENLLATIVNNVQISVQNVHIRFEDTVTRHDGRAIVAGLAFQGLTAITTNQKWKPTQIDIDSSNIFKLVKLETFYFYWNPSANPDKLVKNDLKTFQWIDLMTTSIFNCSIYGEEFDFVLKPIIAKVKLIFNKSKELRVPKLLVDCVLQDASIELSQAQYISILRVWDTLQRVEVNRRYWRFRPLVPVKGNSASWWVYAFNAIKSEFIQTHSWAKIKRHRDNYRSYRALYKQRLLQPNDLELRVDLQVAEDALDVANLVMAQEEAKLEVASEEPDIVETTGDDTVDTRPSTGPWWLFWLGMGSEPSPRPQPALIQIKSEKENLWTKLAQDEKEKLYEVMMSFADSPTQADNASASGSGAISDFDLDKYIAHKINFTLANCTLSLIDDSCEETSDREILVVSLNQLLGSIETRPSANGFKLSVRAETLVVEGIAGGSNSYELIPIITADRTISATTANKNDNSNTNHKTYIFALDFEKNPLNVKANYSLTGQVDPIEILYQYQSICQLIDYFIDVPMLFSKRGKEELKRMAKEALVKTSRMGRKNLYEYAVEKQSNIYLNLDIKAPYIVIPEAGAIERGGRVLVFDLGRLTVKSDLQQELILLDNPTVTASEIEEKLYDRIHVTLSDVQILFSDSGDEWRAAKEVPESDIHIMPRLHVHVLCSRSLRPEYRLAPKHKLNVTVAALRLNLSDRRIRLLNDFMAHTPLPGLPSSHDLIDYSKSMAKPSPVYQLFDLDPHWVQRDPPIDELRSYRYMIGSIPMTLVSRSGSYRYSGRSSVDAVVDASSFCQGINHSQEDPYFSASDLSDCSDSEPIVAWARVVDVPGFDDNVSPSNTIQFLVRFTIGEILIHLSRSSDVVDKPYLMLRAEKLNLDISWMTFGPALQASLRKLQLVDKQHSCSSGGYLELITTPSDGNEMLTVLYRKVKASCPDFKTHFHLVEHSLVLDLTSVSFIFHRESIITMMRFVSYVIDSVPIKFIRPIKSGVNSIIPVSPTSLMMIRKTSDPPIPAGATKFSLSVHLADVSVGICETEADLAIVTMIGFECDYVQKANDKYILRMDLADLRIVDESEDTLYPNVLRAEGDEKVFSLKFMKKSPYQESQSTRIGSLEEKIEDISSDGSFKLRIGQVHFVLLYKFVADMFHFFEPFILPNQLNHFKRMAKRKVNESLTKMSSRSKRIQLNVDIKAPTIIIPQKANSPNLIIANLGQLSIENFFTEVKSLEPSTQPLKQIVDNVLLRLTNLQVNRGTVMMGTSDANSTIASLKPSLLEPFCVRLDLKQALYPRVVTQNILSLEVTGSVDVIKLKLSKKDLAIMVAIYQENIQEGMRAFKTSEDLTATSAASPTAVSVEISPEASDPVQVKPFSRDEQALESFLSQVADGFKDKYLLLNLEGIELTLFNDKAGGRGDSPLCKVEAEDLTTSLDIYMDKTLELKITLQSLEMEDMRKDANTYVKKTFQTYNPFHPPVDPRFRLSVPPMIDLTYKRTALGEGSVDVMAERTRFNLSVPFLLDFYKFFNDALPSRVEMAQVPMSALMNTQLTHKKRLPSDITSGFHSTAAEDEDMDEKKSLSISAVVKKLEVVLYADPVDINSRLLVLRFDSMFDYTRNNGEEKVLVSLVGMQMMSCLNGRRSETASMVLYPFDAQMSKVYRSSDGEVNASVRLSEIDVRLSAPIFRIFVDLSNEVSGLLSDKSPHEEETSASSDENQPENTSSSFHLWLPRKIYPEKWFNTITYNNLLMSQRRDSPTGMKEKFKLNLSELRVFFEDFNGPKLMPFLYSKAVVELEVNDWSNRMMLTSNCQLEVLHFNERLASWEPLLEPVMESENKYRSLEINLKAFKETGQPIVCFQYCQETGSTVYTTDAVDGPGDDNQSLTGSGSRIISGEESTSEESDSDQETVIIKRKVNTRSHFTGSEPRGSKHGSKRAPSVKSHESLKSTTSMHVVESSDSDAEEGVFGKIAIAFGQMMSDNSSADDSDHEGILGLGEVAESAEDAAADDLTSKSEGDGADSIDSDISSNLMGKVNEGYDEADLLCDTVDGKYQKSSDNPMATYVVVTVNDKIDLNITPIAIKNIYNFINILQNSKRISVFEADLLSGGYPRQDPKSDAVKVDIVNLLGPEATIKVLQKEDVSSSRYKCLTEVSGRDWCPNQVPSSVASTRSSFFQSNKVASDALVDILGAEEDAFDDPNCDDHSGSDYFEVDEVDGCFKTKLSESEHLSLSVQNLSNKYFEPDLSDLYEKQSSHRISVEVEGLGRLQFPMVSKATKAIYPIQPPKDSRGIPSRTRYFVVIDVDLNNGIKVITASSPLLLENNLGRPVLVLCLKESLEKIGASIDDYAKNPFHEKYVQLVSLEDKARFNVPLLVAYNCKLFIQPIALTQDEPCFELSTEGLWWQDIVGSVASGSTQRHKFISCPAAEPDKPGFWLKVVPIENKGVKAPNFGIKTVPNLTLHLFAPVIIHNSLCYPIDLVIDQNNGCSNPINLKEGEVISFFSLEVKREQEIMLEVKDYLNYSWRGKFAIRAEMEEETRNIPMSRVSPEGPVDPEEAMKALQKQITACIQANQNEEGPLHVHIFSPYWIINKTGLLGIEIRGTGSDTIWPFAEESEPILFRFKKRKKKKARLRVNNSSWSSSFPLDTVGNKGVVTCFDKERKKKYRFFVDIALSAYNPMTKIVSFLPYLMVYNLTTHHLCFMEENEDKDLWLEIAPNQCLPYYPDGDSMSLFVKTKHSKIISQHFPANSSHKTVLRMAATDSLQALTVDVEKSENSSTVIKFCHYSEGDAPVRVDNFCEDLFFKIHQKDMGQVTLLSPYQSVLYTWDDPVGERTLIWNLYNRKRPGFVSQTGRDGFGHELVSFHSIKEMGALSRSRAPSTRKSAHSSSSSHSSSRHLSRRKSAPHPPPAAAPSSGESDDSSPDERENTGEVPDFKFLKTKRKQLRKDKVAVHWVSYLDSESQQRVLLFTQDERIAKEARKVIGGQIATHEIFLTINSGLGVSVINDNYEELGYISTSSAPAFWEVEINHKWKHLTLELASWLEDKWTSGSDFAELKDYIQVDLSPKKMIMTKPFYGKLRRTFSPSTWLQVRRSPQQTYINAKVHRLQVDNQLADAVFPIVFYPIKSGAGAGTGSGSSKPFLEAALFLSHSKSEEGVNDRKWNRKRGLTSKRVDVVKYLKVLVQEFAVKLDKGFLLSFYDFYSTAMSTKEKDPSVLMMEDLYHIQKPIQGVIERTQTLLQQKRESKIIYEYIHFSPLKVRVSFSLRGQTHSSASTVVTSWGVVKKDVVDFFVNALGATLTDFKDLDLQMAFFELSGAATFAPKRLLASIKSHYILQLTRQAYVLILGLDILGNPYGLVRDFTQGLGDFFYEPFMGSVFGPEKFASSISRGMQSLLGHVVGGTSGSVSLVTGAVGQLLAQLTFDEEFKRKRQQRLQMHPNTVPEVLSLSSKGLVLGVALGVSGIFTKPVTGAQEEGVEGFFKGMGKGLLGLISKPAAGVADMVAISFDGIHRAMDLSPDVVIRSRLPRYINKSVGLRPYSPYQAKGYRLLLRLSKGRFSESDIYWAHAPLAKTDRSDIFLLTDKHMFLLSHCRYWGGWDVEWLLNVDDLVTVPSISEKTLLFKIRQESSSFLVIDKGIANSSFLEYRLECEDLLVLNWIQSKIEEVILFNISDRTCVNLV